VFVSSRVHPGEVPASHIMHGILEYLQRLEDAQVIRLLDQFVFKIVPIINPDGVSRGHYRLDSLGQNLNRFYQEPDPLKQPTVYAIVQYIKYLHSEQRLKLYMDLHAHARKEGCFIYGNHSEDLIEKAQQMLYPKLISLNCRNFDF